MFDTIAGRYDGLNRVISLGIDQKWRRKVVELVAASKPDTILDIATGTGDLVIAMANTSANQIVGVDISEGMLKLGRKKIKQKKLEHRLQMVVADGESLPFSDHYFDAITVAFGVRNFENLEKGLSEILRVLKPKGILIILEASIPTNPIYKMGYQIYCKAILPIMAKLFSKDKKAYEYLVASVAAFPYGKKLDNILQKIGFINTEYKPQTLGVATLYVASK